LYYDIFIGKVGNIKPRQLIEYAFSKKVIICSPSSFYASSSKKTSKSMNLISTV